MAKQPKIRFKGFTEEWNEKTFSELYYRAIEKNDLSFGPDKIISVANMFYRPDASGVSTDEYMRTYNIMRVGDIAYEGNKSANFANGRWVENYIGDGIISHVFEVLRPKTKYDLMYWRYAINNEYIMRRKLMLSTKKATMMTNIVVPDFLKQTISVPTIPEQEKIGGFLSHIDSTISRRETELEKLKNIKRALLEKLFPQDGQSTPAIRFKGFNEKWSDVPFGKLIIENKEVSTVENEDTLLSSAIEGMFLNSELFGHQRGQSNIGYRKITKGMLILSAQNLHLGNANVNLRFDHGIVSPAYKTYIIQGADTEFMAVWVKREETKAFFDRATTAGASKCRKNINWDDLYQQDLAMPLDEEQKKIGKFILTLDRLITLREKYIKQLKHSKQALLEQMFVNN